MAPGWWTLPSLTAGVPCTAWSRAMQAPSFLSGYCGVTALVKPDTGMKCG